MLTRRRLLQRIDIPAVEAAVARAESRTSGEIRVTMAPYFWGNVLRAAERTFQRLGMTATRERNAVLIFVVPARRSHAVVGDVGIHTRVGAEFRDRLSERMSAAFRAGRYTEGLVAAVEAVGERLARDFPIAASDRDELPNKLVVADGPLTAAAPAEGPARSCPSTCRD